MGKSLEDIQKINGSVKAKVGLSKSINDIREMYYDGSNLTDLEKLALRRFDDYRIWYLNSADGELEFHNRYEELQAKANLGNYEQFLDEKYSLPRQ